MHTIITTQKSYNLMQWLYDTHIHLTDPEYIQDLPVIIHNMECMGIKACCVSMNADDSARSLAISKMSPTVIPFVGIHPERASSNLDSVLDIIDQNIKYIAGIGEIGLDPSFCTTDADYTRQRTVFEELLRIAEKYNKPVSIHSRKSLDDVLSVLSSYSLKNVCLHWFDGNKKQLRRAMEMNLFVAFGPVTVYANDKQALLSRADLDKILVETDGPVRFSRCFGGMSAQPSFIPSVIFAASKILQKSYDEMCQNLQANSERFLGI